MPTAEEQKYSPQQSKIGPKLVKIAEKLLPGENVQRDGETTGTQLVSKSAAYRLRFQTDGNLVGYWNATGQAYWSPNLANRGVTHVTMQTDGNLVAYAGNQVLWDTGTQGHPGAWLNVQDDGNLVVYDTANRPLWSSHTVGGHTEDTGGFLGIKGLPNIIGPIEWLARAAASAGRDLSHVLSEGIGALANLAGQIPLIGTPIHAVLSIAGTPFKAVDAVVHGSNIAETLIQTVKDEVSAVREIAPYARLVVSAIPGLGSGINAAIAFGSAAVSGVPLDEAMMAGIKGAIPYGEIAKATYDFTRKVVAGENVVKATVSSALAQLPQAAREALDVLQHVAAGDNIPMLALEKARQQLPEAAQKGLDIGVAIGQGRKLQSVIATAVQGLDATGIAKFAANGVQVIADTPLLKASASLVKTAEQSHGFKVGAAVLNFAGVNETTVYQFRQKLTKDAQVGFDLAVSARIGKVTSKAAPSTLTSTQKAAFYTTKGMAGGAPLQKAAMMIVVASNPAARAGAEIAITEMPPRRGLWRGLLHFLGLD